MDEGIVNLIVLVLAGAGMLAQYLVKQSRARASRPAHGPVAHSARVRSSPRPASQSEPQSEPQMMSFEDVLAHLLGREPATHMPVEPVEPIEPTPPRQYQETELPPPPPAPPAVSAQAVETAPRAAADIVMPGGGVSAARPMPPALAALAGRAATDLRAVVVMKEILDAPVGLR